MKRITFLMGLCLFLMASGLMAQPQGKPAAPMPPPIPNLTAEQQAKIQNLQLQLAKDSLPLHAQLQTLEPDLKLVMTADKFDEGKAKYLVEQMQKLHTDLQMKHILHEQSLRQLLTPEQRQQFDLHLLAPRPHGEPVPRGGMAPNGPQPPRPPMEPNQE